MCWLSEHFIEKRSSVFEGKGDVARKSFMSLLVSRICYREKETGDV